MWFIVELNNCISLVFLMFQLAETRAHTHNLHRLITGQIVEDMSPDSFVLLVDRNNLVDSTTIQLGHSTENFKKPLRVRVLLVLVWECCIF